MDVHATAKQLAYGRVAIGAGLIVAPRRLAGPWLGQAAGTPAVRVLAAGFGARDAAIGAGTALALHGNKPARDWLLAGALCDAADLLATLAFRRSLPPLGAAGISALAAVGAVASVWAARELGQSTP